MAKYNKIGGKVVEITELSERELTALLKVNVNCALTFKSNGEIINYIGLFDRGFKSNVNTITIGDSKTKKIVKYDTLVLMIQEYIAEGILSVQITIADFQAKEPLILMIGDINTDVISGCVFLDYRDGTFSIVNRPSQNGGPNKLFYFEQNDSVLGFGNNGPVLIYDKFHSVDEILCK